MKNSNKNAIFVDANVMNISAKFRLYPTYDLWREDFSIFFRKFSFSVAMQPTKFKGLDKNDMFGRGLLKEHFL